MTIPKVYKDGSDMYELIFHFGSENINPDFEVISISPIEYGDFDTDELAFFPANLTIVLGGFNGNNYDFFKKTLENYNDEIVFNFKYVFYVEYKKNGNLLYSGILANYLYDDRAQTLEILLSDASEKFKKVNIDHPGFLMMMSNKGLPFERINYKYGNNQIIPLPMYAFGLKDQYVNYEDGKYRFHFDDGIDFAVPFRNFISWIFQSVNENCNFTLDIDLLFGDSPDTCTHSIDELWINGIFGNYLGKYVVVLAGWLHTPQNLDEKFERVYKSDNPNDMEVWILKDTRGLADKNIMSLIKELCYNFFGRMAWESYDKISFVKKFSVQGNLTMIEDKDIIDGTFRKEKFLAPKKYVNVYDAFRRDYSGVRGINTSILPDEDKVQYEIKFSAYQTSGSSGYNLFYFENNQQKPVYYAKDPATGYTEKLPEVLAELEWMHRKHPRDKYSMKLWGTDYKFSQNFKFLDENGNYVFLRPMRMSIDEESNITEAEFIDITNYQN